jgi:hypothetical protein
MKLQSAEASPTPQVIDSGVRIGHFRLKVAGLERALAFYCGVPRAKRTVASSPG